MRYHDSSSGNLLFIKYSFSQRTPIAGVESGNIEFRSKRIILSPCETRFNKSLCRRFRLESLIVANDAESTTMRRDTR